MDKCSKCGDVFNCRAGSDQECWCGQYPPVLPVVSGQSCLCEKCLREAVEKQVSDEQL